jgi:hypothetical protein
MVGRDPAGRRLCTPAKFGRGVCGRSSAEPLNPGRRRTSIHDFFVRFCVMDDLVVLDAEKKVSTALSHEPEVGVK